ncbi:MAG: PLDc N-terminal domain-containing protein [Planctomycetales bacterium]|nr:PLDc N-terminal domain-containing protein [Planctomycetales bacterium]
MMTWWQSLEVIAWSWVHVLLLVLMLVVHILTSVHIALNKREPRSAVTWMVSTWFMPFLGAVLYFWFGVNRLQRKARHLRLHSHHPRYCLPAVTHEVSANHLNTDFGNLIGIAKAIGSISGFPLVWGNKVEPLQSGEAYFEMLHSIGHAKRSITLITYIFDDDLTGQEFVAALSKAVGRGVAVRVLVDDVGAMYSRPTIWKRLDSARIPRAAFLTRFLPIPFAYWQLRNHRKIMVVDGSMGYTGGMNIRHNQSGGGDCKFPIQDLHFKVQGPVVSQLQTTFAEDWWFTTREYLEGEPWYPMETQPVGETIARGIPDGPDEDLDNLRLTYLAAIGSASQSIKLVTPYFLPDQDISTALSLAALRGVEVDILIPEQSNLRLVQWATTPYLLPLIQRGCRIWLTPPPFDHSKLLLVDGHWTLVGSANWDQRSLRLNFEFNVECYDRNLTRSLDRMVEKKLFRATQVTEEKLAQQSIAVRLRDGLARMLAPIL